MILLTPRFRTIPFSTVFLGMLILTCGLSLGLVSAPLLNAGEYNEVLSPGSTAPAWVDLPGVDGKKYSLADLKDKEIVVVVFTCNSCPFAVDYEDRIITLAKRYASAADSRVAFVAINVNRIEADSLPKMKERADKKQFPFPYLFDETQKIAKAYGANFTPEFFVLNRDRQVVYMGGCDDNSQANMVKEHYLEPAIQGALQGKLPKIKETLPRGCRIRYVRDRK